MGRVLGFWAIALLAPLFISLQGHAYTPTVTSAGTPLRWSGKARLPLAGNPINRSGLSEKEVFDAVVRGLRRWQTASQGQIDFDYWQGKDPSVYEPNSKYN